MSTHDINLTPDCARTILDSITDAFFALDREWRVTYMNSQAQRLVGRAPAAVLGKDFWGVAPGVQGSEFETAQRKAMTEKIAASVTAVYPHHDRWYELHSYPSPDGILVCVRDVTERRRAENRLRVSEVRYRRLFEAARDGILIVDMPTRKITDANPFMIELLDFPRDHFLGKELWEIGVFRDKDESEAAMQQLHEKGFIRYENLPLQDRNGGCHAVEVVANIYQEDHQPVIQYNIRDISERKRFEDDRATHLTNEQSLRMEAETANLAKDKFLAVLSHELRTPLSPVVMTIHEIEVDPDLPVKFRDGLAMLRRNIDLEVKLIDDLLDLSRVTSGKLRLQMQSVRVHEVLRHAIDNSTSDTSSKRLSIHQEFHATNDHLMADPARLQQVFWNLLRNAVKFTPEEGNITVRTSNPGDNGRLLVEVKDSGVGIEPDMLPRIFDAFEQGDFRVARLFGGLGLGLAIAKAVVEMHGGMIIAASRGRDQGATFTVQLDTASESMSKRIPAPDSLIMGKQEFRPCRVLLVEDHPDTARVLTRLLKGSGHDVKTAHSVASALQLAATEPFDILVSDIGLPDATGYELMEQIRDRYGIKGIALSGYGMDDDVHKSREAGFVDHIVKPVNFAQLEAVIRRVTSADANRA
jgi:PAS domain S-box-containing protein